jgi:hypothetical protein
MKKDSSKTISFNYFLRDILFMQYYISNDKSERKSPCQEPRLHS